ncbi:MAG: hypothetical protein LBB59_00970 [Campylobacteraceae bacterium]|jgi:hypothetical protein|nr:hypothetical protein [Campylobacteraceae bacterium]
MTETILIVILSIYSAAVVVLCFLQKKFIKKLLGENDDKRELIDVLYQKLTEAVK